MSQPPSAVAGQAPQQGGGQPSPEEMKRVLSEAIQKIKQLCEQNGLNFNELVGGVGQPPV